MKFLANDSRVRQSLEKWAAEAKKDPVLSKFFFWRHGSTDQKTVYGLLRGLLYDMCRASPRVVRMLFPRLHASNRWDADAESVHVLDEGDIRAAFDQIRTNVEIHEHFRFCFFVDGLDEFDGEEMAHWKLAKMLAGWTSGPLAIKLCVSSREDHSIVSAFQGSRQIQLQDLTEGDIAAIINDTLLTTGTSGNSRPGTLVAAWHSLTLYAHAQRESFSGQQSSSISWKMSCQSRRP